MNSLNSPPTVRGRTFAGRIIIVLATVCLGAGIAVALRSPTPPPAAAAPQIPEVLRSDLVLREQQLFRGSETQAFTGWMIERYTSGAYKSRSAVRSGRLEGVSEGWTTNGVLQVREHFRQGISHGPRIKWYANGAKRSEATIDQGVVTGVFRRWHEDGSLAEVAEMDRDVPHGTSRSFYPGGAPKSEVTLDHGEIRSQRYWPDPRTDSVMVTAKTR